ncbi:MAG: hypothetical protein ABR910_15720 [Acidobacteriaceae bacterium]|jgi:uncharacterized DUF497 family protein
MRGGLAASGPTPLAPHTLRRAGDTVLLLVAHTLHDGEGEEIVRIISASKAGSHEGRFYEASQQ